MDAELVGLLACPKCHGQLELRPHGAPPQQATECVCRACRLAYAIEGDIPNFLVEEARPSDG